MTKENAQPQATASSKTCTKCGETKSTEEFHKDKYRKGGLRSDCKPCNRKRSRKWREANPEKAREQNRKWREANHEYTRERNRRWREANHEYNRERNRKWREANPEYDRERSLKWREANPDKVHAQQQERLAKRSRRVARIRKMMAHFDGRTGWLEKLAGAIAMRSDAQGLSWIASDIDELLLIHFYKEV